MIQDLWHLLFVLPHPLEIILLIPEYAPKQQKNQTLM